MNEFTKDKPTSQQLVDLIDDELDITICRDVVYGLDFEYKQLEQERDKYKSIVEGINNHIENCLENDKYCNLSSEPKDRCRIEIWGEVKDKIKELEEGKDND